VRAIVDVERDDVGRLVGKVTCPGAGSGSFCGLVELVGLIEAGLDDEDGERAAPGSNERS